MVEDRKEGKAREIEGPNSTWVVVAKAGTEEEARIIEGFLDSEGIPAEVEVVRFNAEPVNFGDMSQVRIYVAAANQARALEILRERELIGDEMRSDDSVMTDEGAAEIGDGAETAPDDELP